MVTGWENTMKKISQYPLWVYSFDYNSIYPYRLRGAGSLAAQLRSAVIVKIEKNSKYGKKA